MHIYILIFLCTYMSSSYYVHMYPDLIARIYILILHTIRWGINNISTFHTCMQVGRKGQIPLFVSLDTVWGP